MTTALDVLDILELNEAGPKKTIIDKETILARSEKKKAKNTNAIIKRPENVPREVWGLQSTLKEHELPSLIPTDDFVKYRQPKAVIGVGRVGRWLWTSFTNPTRKDGLVLHHWRREKPTNEPEEVYPFAQYDKHVAILEYTLTEYTNLLQNSNWSEEKTEHLMELARRFDLHFIHMRDRWDASRFPNRPSIEDMKERYYAILISLDKARGTNLADGLHYDAPHERRRKQQLSLLYGRTNEQVEEEQRLVQELRKIEARRRERERKKQDLQKLISQADTVLRDTNGGTDIPPGSAGSVEGGTITTPSIVTPLTSQRKRGGLVSSSTTGSASVDALLNLPSQSASQSDLSTSLGAAAIAANVALTTNYVINFPDPAKNPGVYLRSQKMKLPMSLGQKKIRLVENFLAHLQLDPIPPATAEIVEAYNNLRCKIPLLHDLRMANLLCDYELQSARLRLETFTSDQPLPAELVAMTKSMNISVLPADSTGADSISSIDQDILNALRDADSKRPVLPRHSLGVAGSLAAVAGSSGFSFSSSSSDLKHATRSALSPPLPDYAGGPSEHTADSLNVHRTGGTRISASESNVIHSGLLKRRRRAAALEQGRVLKKLKIKGQLVD